MIASLPLKKEISVSYWRAGKKSSTRLSSISTPFTDELELEISGLGMVVQNISQGIFRMHNLSDYQGVFISSLKPGSRGEEANLRRGDVLYSINGKSLSSATDFQEKFETVSKLDQPIFMELRRNGHPYFAVIYPDPAP